MHLAIFQNEYFQREYRGYPLAVVSNLHVLSKSHNGYDRIGFVEVVQRSREYRSWIGKSPLRTLRLNEPSSLPISDDGPFVFVVVNFFLFLFLFYFLRDKNVSIELILWFTLVFLSLCLIRAFLIVWVVMIWSWWITLILHLQNYFP